MNLKDMKVGVDDCIKLLLYGPSGTGKTHFAGTFPAPIYVFDFDHKVKPLYGRDVECDSYDTTKENILNEYNRFRKKLDEVLKDPTYKTVIIDSMSTLDPAIMQFLIRQSGRALEYPDIQTYGHHQDHWTWLVMKLCSSAVKKNVILIGHDQYKVLEDSQTHRICPLIAGDKIQGKLPGLWEETYYYTTVQDGGKPVRRLYYRTTNKAIASSAVLSGNGYLDEPTYEKLKAEMIKCAAQRKV